MIENIEHPSLVIVHFAGDHCDGDGFDGDEEGGRGLPARSGPEGANAQVSQVQGNVVHAVRL